MKPVLTGDLQGGMTRVGERGVGGIPLMFRNKKIKFKNDKGFSFYFSFLFLLGDGGVSPLSGLFLKNKRPTLIFARKQILSHPIG